MLITESSISCLFDCKSRNSTSLIFLGFYFGFDPVSDFCYAAWEAGFCYPVRAADFYYAWEAGFCYAWEVGFCYHTHASDFYFGRVSGLHCAAGDFCYIYVLDLHCASGFDPGHVGVGSDHEGDCDALDRVRALETLILKRSAPAVSLAHAFPDSLLQDGLVCYIRNS